MSSLMDDFADIIDALTDPLDDTNYDDEIRKRLMEKFADPNTVVGMDKTGHRNAKHGIDEIIGGLHWITRGLSHVPEVLARPPEESQTATLHGVAHEVVELNHFCLRALEVDLRNRKKKNGTFYFQAEMENGAVPGVLQRPWRLKSIRLPKKQDWRCPKPIELRGVFMDKDKEKMVFDLWGDLGDSRRRHSRRRKQIWLQPQPPYSHGIHQKWPGMRIYVDTQSDGGWIPSYVEQDRDGGWRDEAAA